MKERALIIKLVLSGLVLTGGFCVWIALIIGGVQTYTVHQFDVKTDADREDLLEAMKWIHFIPKEAQIDYVQWGYTDGGRFLDDYFAFHLELPSTLIQEFSVSLDLEDNAVQKLSWKIIEQNEEETSIRVYYSFEYPSSPNTPDPVLKEERKKNDALLRLSRNFIANYGYDVYERSIAVPLLLIKIIPPIFIGLLFIPYGRIYRYFKKKATGKTFSEE